MKKGRKGQDDAATDARRSRSRRQLDALASAGVSIDGVPTSTLEIDVAIPDVPERVVEEVMERVGWVVQSTIRDSDVFYRADRSVFCVLLPATDGEHARLARNRIERAMLRATLPAYAPVTVRLLDEITYA